MSKKSAAQLRRMLKRAESRGETYEIPAALLEKQQKEQKLKAACKLKEALEYLEENKDGLNSKEKRSAKRKAEAIAVGESGDTCTIDDLMEWYAEEISQNSTTKATSVDHSRIRAFTKYQETLTMIESNEDLKSKDRRSAKRRADAIACDESKFENIEDLINWHEENKDISNASNAQTENRKRKAEELNDGHSKKVNPYILFVGQIPYDCTVDRLFEHFQKYMGKKIITKDSLQIRIPAEDKEKAAKRMAKSLKDEEKNDVASSSRNKGFAFAEFKDPELMYECLKLHHTDVDGRRINVLRSAGGGKASRAEKIKLRQKEQEDYISSTVDKIIEDYISKGELQEGELDEGAVLLCKRRSAAIVEAALSQYIADRGDRDLENPSSFFSRIICRVTEDGIDSVDKKSQQKRHGDSRKKERYQKKEKDTSVLRSQGVDMSISDHNDTTSGERSLTSIFPSMGRGRGRGRGGYM